MATPSKTPHEQKKTSLTASIRVLAANQKRHVGGLPLQVDKAVIGRAVQVQITPDQFPLFKIDREHYQRPMKEGEINLLIHVLKSGGFIPDPVRIVQRGDGSFWVIDGQQRFEAHRRCELPFDALLYKFDDLETERKFFLVSNRGIRVSTDSTVHAWPGPSAQTLRTHARRSGSAFFNHVDFGTGEGRRAYSAALILRAACALLSPSISRSFSPVQVMLERLDMLLVESGSMERMEALFKLIPLVFPPGTGTFRYLPGLALAAASRIHWQRQVNFPSPTIYNRLARIEWQRVSPQTGYRFLPVLRNEILGIWKPPRDSKAEEV